MTEPREDWTWRSWAMLLLVGLLAAMALRWPFSGYEGLFPLDPNSDLHTLAARNLAQGNDPLLIADLGWPGGTPLVPIAWPIILIAAALNSVVSAVAAMQLSLIAWLWLQIVAVGLLGRQLGWSIHASLVASLAVSFAPQTVQYLGNGQFEHLTALPFCLVIAGALRGRRLGPALVFLGVLLAAFCSPYQGLVAWVLVFALGITHPRARWSIAAATAAMVPPALYFSLALRKTVIAPSPGGIHEGTKLSELLPTHMLGPVQGMMDGTVTAPAIRYIDLSYAFGLIIPTHSGFLGLVLSVVGIWGLWTWRKSPLGRALILAAALLWVLSLGNTLALTERITTPIPLPWALAELLPGLDKMSATFRLLTGTTFVLALGAAHVLQRHGRPWALALVGLLVVEGLWLSEAHWPAPAAVIKAADLMAELPDGPLAVWPGPPTVASDHAERLVLLLDRPIVWFAGWATRVDTSAAGTRSPDVINTDISGRNVDQWLTDICSKLIAGVLELPNSHVPLKMKPKAMRLSYSGSGINFWTWQDACHRPRR